MACIIEVWVRCEIRLCMAFAAVPRRRPAAGYTHVPKFRFSTPPRARAAEGDDEHPNDEELSHETAQEWRIEASGEALHENSLSEGAAELSNGPATFAMPQFGSEVRSRTQEVLASDLATQAEAVSSCGHASADEGNRGLEGTEDGEEEVHIEAPDASGADEDADDEASSPVPASVAKYLSQAYDDEGAGATGFRWTGVVDAAHAAWIGGTRLLRYGEILPGGAARGLECLLGDRANEAANSDAGIARNQLCLELGMGRGRLALQLFLSGATVIGVELASERYKLAVGALERLAHRCPEQFEISRRTAEAIRIRRKGGPKGAICEVRHGNFFDVVSADEVNAATLIFLQVCLPPPTWPRVRELIDTAGAGCKILSYEDMERMWKGDGGASGSRSESFPFTAIGAPRLACSWAAKKGHRFYCYECPDPANAAYNHERECQQRHASNGSGSTGMAGYLSNVGPSGARGFDY